MRLHDFAQQLLFGDTLADKLLVPGPLEDSNPGRAIKLPSAPGRPSELPLRTSERPRFPASQRLADVDAAATALHAFANHELLALELMALVLLRFPDADPAFRADVARTLVEEQAHLSLYLGRLDELKQPFGSRALSAYFWDALSDVASPKDYCAAMGLTLEQANLDFAGHFAEAFEDAGDDTSARILRRVMVDEVAHVARGLRWFDRLRGEGDRWEHWVAALPPGLSPRRARGPDFSVALRIKAGLDPDFVQRVRTFGASRGRPPDVHWLNLPAEAEDGPRSRAWLRDLEATAILRASDDDMVLVHRRPGRLWLSRLAEAGFALPRLELIDDVAPIRVEGPVGSLQPWAATAEAAGRLFQIGDLPVLPAADKVADGELLAQLLPTLGPAERLLEPDALPRTASTRDEVEHAIATFRAAGHHRVVFKRPLGTAGRGQLRLFEGSLSPAQGSWLSRALESGPVRVEPWLDRCLDLSFQLDAGGLRGVVRFDADATGRFRSASLQRPTVGLDGDVARFWAGDGRDAGWIEAVGRRLASALGPAGAIGIDAFLYRSADGLRLHPFVERNPRVTFGRLALDLRSRLAPGAVGRWILLGPAELRRSSFESFCSLSAALDVALPLERRRGQIRRCALPTGDPEEVETVLPMLLVAGSEAELSAALEGVGLPG